MFLAQCQQPPWCVETKTSRNSSNPCGRESNFIWLTCSGLWPLQVSTDDPEMSLHACQNWRTLWIKKPHWQFSLLLQLLKSLDRTQSSQKCHGGEKKKTIQSNKTNWALYWQDWIVLQMIAAWSKKILPGEPVKDWNVAKGKCVPVNCLFVSAYVYDIQLHNNLLHSALKPVQFNRGHY